MTAPALPTRLLEEDRLVATLDLLGGSALCLLGSPRSTLDIDYDVDFEELKRYFAIVLPAAPRADVDPREFQAYFAEIENRHKRL